MKNFREFLLEKDYSERRNYLSESSSGFDEKSMRNSNAFRKASQILSKAKIKLNKFYLINNGSYDFWDSIPVLEFSDNPMTEFSIQQIDPDGLTIGNDDDYGIRFCFQNNKYSDYTKYEMEEILKDIQIRMKICDDFIKLNRSLKEKDYYIYDDPTYF